MPLKKLLFIFLFLGLFSQINAKNFKLGKVSIAELKEKEYSIDSTVAAVVLFNKANTFFSYDIKNGFSINTEQVFRIKIYKKEGLKWANFKVSYYVGYENYNDDKVEFDNCVTYNIEDGKIVKTKLTREGEFNTSINKYWKEASITMPNVRVGSVIEYRYILKSENIVKFPVFNFQQKIPVNYSEYITKIPGFFIYKAIKRGAFEIKFESKLEGGQLSYANKYNLTRTKVVSFQQVNNKYIAQNIPALKEEPFVDNIDNYRVSIYNELERTQFPDEKPWDYSSTWEGVAKSIFRDNNFGKQLEERDFLMQDIKLILKDIEDKKKLNVIFEFVKNRMNWNKEYGYFTDKGVKKAYLEKTGNCAEINFILIDMLKLAGIEANPVLTSTIDHGIPVYPNRTVFNYVVAAVGIEGKQVLLDATQKYTTQNILPLHILNRIGRLIRANGTSEEINLSPSFQSNVNTSVLANVNAQGQVSGKLRIQNTDYEAYSFREKNNLMSQETYLDKLENELGGVLVTDYKVDNRETDLMNPVSETFSFVSNNHCERIGGKLFLNPLLFFAFQKNPFVMEKRQMPLYFGFPKQTRYNLSLEIPDGYGVESLPKALKIATEGNTAVFSIISAVTGRKIQVSIISEINKTVIAPEYYMGIKKFFQKMIATQNEKIVLIKI